MRGRFDDESHCYPRVAARTPWGRMVVFRREERVLRPRIRQALSQRYFARFSCHALRRWPTAIFEVEGIEVEVLRRRGLERGAALALTPSISVELRAP